MSAFKTSASGRAFIEKEEGVILHAYNDGTGTLTIGVGHTSAAGLPHVYPGMIITVPQSDMILASDLAAVEIDINHHVKISLNPNQFDALASFDFNTGALDRSGLLALVNSGCTDPAKITAAFVAWRFARVHGIEVPELLGRRQREAKLYLTPMLAA